MTCHIKTARLIRGGLFILFLSMSISLGYATTPSEWQIELCESLHALKSGDFLDPTLQELSTLALSLQDSDTAIKAILEIFVEGTQGTEIFWWKSENRAARCFLLALKVRYNDEYWLSDIESYIKRFNEHEQQERSEELAFVLAYRSGLAGTLADILKKRDIDKYNSEFKGFEGVATMKLGKPLPDWCHAAQ
jgi:hypothetical protein